tara:strand:- start:169 stop:432 length:264 start_codon:yes stop_codon:yes gene_type:complete
VSAHHRHLVDVKKHPTQGQNEGQDEEAPAEALEGHEPVSTTKEYVLETPSVRRILVESMSRHAVGDGHRGQGGYGDDLHISATFRTN